MATPSTQPLQVPSFLLRVTFGPRWLLYGTRASRYHSSLALATEVGKHMSSPLLSAPQTGSSHSPLPAYHLTLRVPAKEASSPEWATLPSDYGAERTMFRLPFSVCHCAYIWKLSPRRAQSPANSEATDQWQSSITPSRRPQLLASYCLLLPCI